ncbi:MAG TPA: Re/Si-specific NAD(P)(+) transhydrogenase subunit alpha [Candidatus Eisenbacteria bacterium]|nr:Re/Si-specific NAD(P)(+) transhydrogenase subunit alpha [Candidatus Eisenbacteria bacterium]
MHIAVPRETAPREQRVALVPESVGRLVRSGHTVAVEHDAGARAGHPDDAYREAGATLAPDFAACATGAGAVLKVREPGPHPQLGRHEVELLPERCALLGLMGRGDDAELMRRYLARRLSVFSLQLLPRISRAQKMDALSSMAAVAGYKVVLLAACQLGKFFPLLMTAAGTVAPARVFVLGAGVAGLQAIATARRLGAVVEAFDVRPAVKEEVHSLGATFVELPLGAAAVGTGGYAKELDEARNQQVRDLIGSHLPTTDVVITTASIPGRRAPLLVTEAMVDRLRPGSVIVDLAAESGGNCALTRPGETVVHGGVTILGPLDLAATVPTHASQMYARNVSALLVHLVKDGALTPDFGDEITRGTCLAHDGRAARDLAPAPAPAPPAPAPTA